MNIFFNSIFRHKKDSKANWTTNNPILLDGEVGIEGDTGNFKVGNGTSTWNDLKYYIRSMPGSGLNSAIFNDFSNNIASGDYSNAMGYSTNAQCHYQTVLGKFNNPTTDSLLLVGNGTDNSNRSNALDLKSSGDLYASGSVYSNNGKLLSGTEVDNKINTKLSSVCVFKSSVNSLSELPTTGMKVGDMYNIRNKSSITRSDITLTAGSISFNYDTGVAHTGSIGVFTICDAVVGNSYYIEIINTYGGDNTVIIKDAVITSSTESTISFSSINNLTDGISEDLLTQITTNFSQYVTSVKLYVGQNLSVDNGHNVAWTGYEWDDIGGLTDLSNYYTKSEVNSIVSGLYRPRGSLNTLSSLPYRGLSIGDVYNIITKSAMNETLMGVNATSIIVYWNVDGVTSNLADINVTNNLVSSVYLDATYSLKFVYSPNYGDPTEEIVYKGIKIKNITSTKITIESLYDIGGISRSGIVNAYEYGTVNSCSLIYNQNLSVDSGHNVAWTGQEWDDIGGLTDLSSYYTRTESDAKYAIKATTLYGYGITDAYTKTQIDGKLVGACRYKGSVDQYSNLPAAFYSTTGDIYNIVSKSIATVYKNILIDYSWLYGMDDNGDYMTITFSSITNFVEGKFFGVYDNTDKNIGHIKIGKIQDNTVIFYYNSTDSMTISTLSRLQVIFQTESSGSPNIEFYMLPIEFSIPPSAVTKDITINNAGDNAVAVRDGTYGYWDILDGMIDLSDYYDKTDIDNILISKSDKTTIQNSLNTSITLSEMTNNTEYRYGIITSMTISGFITTVPEDYITSVTFTGGANITLTITPSVKWIGGVPSVVAGNRYTILFYYDGEYIIAACSEVIL